MPVWDPDKFFASLPLFRGVPPAARAALAWRSSRVTLEKNGFVFLEGAPADASWWVVDGFVKIVKTTPQGRLVTMELLVAGDVFAPAGVMELTTYPASAVAVTACTVLRAPASELARFVKDHPSFPGAVLAEVGRRLRRSHALRALDAESAEKKIAAALLWLSEKTGDVIKVSRRDVADIVGVAPETAIRVVLSFKQKRWVSAATGRITVADPAALRQLVDSE